jgi:hypothetical protein
MPKKRHRKAHSELQRRINEYEKLPVQDQAERTRPGSLKIKK